MTGQVRPFAFWERVSTEDHQDRASSAAGSFPAPGR
jgi:hypothetical protein